MLTAKQIRACFRNYHSFREAAQRENVYSIDGPNGETISLLDMEAIIEGTLLPPRTKEAFILSLVEDMSPEAVASDMAISPGSVAQHVNSALKLIEKEWSS